jgi:multiple sugar transport system permease protein
MSTTMPTRTDAVARTAQRRRGRGAAARRNLTAYLFLAPYLCILLIFTLGAACFGLGLSLFHVNYGIDTPRFVGFDNFKYIWDQFRTNAGNFEFAIGLRNIAIYAVVVITGQTVLALTYAMLLNQKIKGRSFLRTAIYLPSVTSSVAVSLIFIYLYNKGGAINAFLGILHINGPDWLNDTNTALPAIMILNIYTTAPTFMILFLAALQGLPTPVYEAAKVDGATALHIFRYITLPLLRPTVFLIVAVGTIGALQTFDQIAVMTQGGPLNATLTPVYTIYDIGFKQSHFGLAAAMAVILFVIILIVTLIQRRFIDTTIQY